MVFRRCRLYVAPEALPQRRAVQPVVAAVWGNVLVEPCSMQRPKVYRRYSFDETDEVHFLVRLPISESSERIGFGGYHQIMYVTNANKRK